MRRAVTIVGSLLLVLWLCSVAVFANCRDLITGDILKGFGDRAGQLIDIAAKTDEAADGLAAIIKAFPDNDRLAGELAKGIVDQFPTIAGDVLKSMKPFGEKLGFDRFVKEIVQSDTKAKGGAAVLGFLRGHGEDVKEFEVALNGRVADWMDNAGDFWEMKAYTFDPDFPAFLVGDIVTRDWVPQSLALAQGAAAASKKYTFVISDALAPAQREAFERAFAPVIAVGNVEIIHGF